MNRILLLSFTLFFTLLSNAQIDRIEPPNWWVGFKNTKLQLLIKGKDVSNAIPTIAYEGVRIEKIHKADSPNYIFLDLVIASDAKAGDFDIVFKRKRGKKFKHRYQLKSREKSPEDYVGFDSSDAIYLITPDRFANGDTSNDLSKRMQEQKVDREDHYGRHGGDIRGIINKLDYIADMGFTAIWLTPILTNDMKTSSYHGYAITDFYEVDPRFGSLEEYEELATKAQQKGIKLIMDQVANHCGLYHWWMKDLPFGDWVNYQENFERGEEVAYSSHKHTVNQDKYAANADKKALRDGWFVSTMPDLNQRNPFMANYIIQNSIWWAEFLGLGGIRQDTYPYPDKEFMSNWAGAIMKEYPNFNIVGEEMSYNPLLIAYWQQGAANPDGYVSNLKSGMDFPMKENIINAINEDENWNTGLIKIYEGLANDFHYSSPKNLLIFGDNHDKDRIFTKVKEDVTKAKMAMATCLVMPRIPQIYYGTEVLLDNTQNPGHDGVRRKDFPGGWDNDQINGFTGVGLNKDQKDMKSFLKKLINYRKSSTAIHQGKTLHFAPADGIYLLARIDEEETVVLILNKNDKAADLSLDRFQELGLFGKTLKNIHTNETIMWENTLTLKGKGAFIFSTK